MNINTKPPVNLVWTCWLTRISNVFFWLFRNVLTIVEWNYSQYEAALKLYSANEHWKRFASWNCHILFIILELCHINLQPASLVLLSYDCHPFRFIMNCNLHLVQTRKKYEQELRTARPTDREDETSRWPWSRVSDAHTCCQFLPKEEIGRTSLKNLL